MVFRCGGQINSICIKCMNFRSCICIERCPCGCSVAIRFECNANVFCVRFGWSHRVNALITGYRSERKFAIRVADSVRRITQKTKKRCITYAHLLTMLRTNWPAWDLQTSHFSTNYCKQLAKGARKSLDASTRRRNTKAIKWTFWEPNGIRLFHYFRWIAVLLMSSCAISHEYTRPIRQSDSLVSCQHMFWLAPRGSFVTHCRNIFIKPS